MKLFEKQQLFASMVPRLIDFAYDNGYKVTLGDAYRSDAVKYGHANSLHRKRLAIDLNLFREGEYLTSTDAHAPLGAYWCNLHPANRWGGMDGKDGNHYSSFAEDYGMKY